MLSCAVMLSLGYMIWDWFWWLLSIKKEKQITCSKISEGSEYERCCETFLQVYLKTWMLLTWLSSVTLKWHIYIFNYMCTSCDDTVNERRWLHMCGQMISDVNSACTSCCLHVALYILLHILQRRQLLKLVVLIQCRHKNNPLIFFIRIIETTSLVIE